MRGVCHKAALHFHGTRHPLQHAVERIHEGNQLGRDIRSAQRPRFLLLPLVQRRGQTAHGPEHMPDHKACPGHSQRHEQEKRHKRRKRAFQGNLVAQKKALCNDQSVLRPVSP